MISLVSRVTCIRLVLFSTTFFRTANVPFSFFRLPQMNVLFSSWVLQPESYESSVAFVPYFVVQTKFMKEQRTQTFRQMMKHDRTVSSRWNEEKKQINLWRGGDFKERIKPLIARPEFRWNSSRWLERISEKPRVRVKSRFHLQRAVACNQTPWKNQLIDRSTDRSSSWPSPFPSSRLCDRLLVVLSRTRLDLLDRNAQKSPICYEENPNHYATLRAVRNAWITRERERKENLGDCDYSMKTQRDLCNQSFCFTNNPYIIVWIFWKKVLHLIKKILVYVCVCVHAFLKIW